jgi:mycoredoxin
MAETPTEIIMYTSNFCGHSWAVEKFMKEQGVPVQLINIDQDPQARQRLMEINRGYASVPTLLFPDGTQLTEPSFRQLREKLAISKPGLVDKVRKALGRDAD